MQQIEAGDLDVGYVDVGPVTGPAQEAPREFAQAIIDVDGS